MARPKKNIEEIEKEIMGGPVTTQAGKDIEPIKQEVKAGEVLVSKEPPTKLEGAGEFGDEYTLEVIADNEPGADIFRIPKKDPNFEYRYLRDAKENMSVKTSNLLLMKGGWQVVPTSHLINKCGLSKDLLATDGSYRVGELVLAFMPKVLFDKKSAEDRRKTNAAIAGIKRLVEKGDKSKVNIPDVRGITPGRMDGGRVVFDSQSEGKMEYEIKQ